MPRIENSGVMRLAGAAGPILERAGIHPTHGRAIQSFANDFERIVVSRCATPAGIQLLDEGYPSKGFGIKAKSCDWGPFMGFAMAHIAYSKFAGGSTASAYKKQENFFKHAREDTGFSASDHGAANMPFGPEAKHSSMADEADILLSQARLEYLRSHGAIQFDKVAHGEQIRCISPFGAMSFFMVNLNTYRTATWGILHQNKFTVGAQLVTHEAEGEWTLVRGMCNLSPGGTPMDRNRCCCTGDYDLWGVFPKRNSNVASTRSLAKHGMDRQISVFSAVVVPTNRAIGKKILERVVELQQATRDQAVARTHHVYGKYTEDREKGNISALTLHSAREMNRRIRAQGYQGGDMFHHNDDLGNPFRSDVEEDLIAFVPGHPNPHFIQSTTTGMGANEHIGWNAWVRQYEADYAVYDNVAIHRVRR